MVDYKLRIRLTVWQALRALWFALLGRQMTVEGSVETLSINGERIP